MKSLALRFTIVFIALFATLGMYGIWYASIVAKSAEAANLENQINTKTETASRIASTRVALGGVSGDEATVQNYFVSENDVVAFIDNLETRGRAQGTSVSVLSVSRGAMSSHAALILALSIKGPFDEVMRTIGSIEYAPYDLSISELSLGLDAKNSWYATLNVIVGTQPAASSATTTAPSTTNIQQN